MEIWAHTMVKNEARWLWYAVSSIIEHVDKLLLWDTGSTDGSLEIEKKLVNKYPEKIIFRERPQSSPEDFTKVRQEMLDATKSDWFIVADADEIWYESSIKQVVNEIKASGNKIESIVVPTINLVGDIYHYQEEAAGKYRFGSRVGHFNLRAINSTIPGLHSQGIHGVWGWADSDGKMIQDRRESKIKFAEAPYLHATFLPRGFSYSFDKKVVKRTKKLKYEIGQNFPKDFYYPEALFIPRPYGIPSPWQVMSSQFKFRAFVETPLRKIKRRIWNGKAGY